MPNRSHVCDPNTNWGGAAVCRRTEMNSALRSGAAQRQRGRFLQGGDDRHPCGQQGSPGLMSPLHQNAAAVQRTGDLPVVEGIANDPRTLPVRAGVCHPLTGNVDLAACVNVAQSPGRIEEGKGWSG